jgi:hypothetical protein
MALFYVGCTFEVSTTLLVEAETEGEAEVLASKFFYPSDYDADYLFKAESVRLEELEEGEFAERIV